jgi:general secretion pathway protein G
MIYSCSSGKNLKQGFSLIELVIAIAILGILSAIVIPNFLSYLRNANISAAENTIKTLKQGINAFYSKSGEYPKSLEDLVKRPADVPAKKWGGPYIGGEEEEPVVPQDPWNIDYVYKLNPKGAKPPYQLYSWGPNGEGSPEDEWIF